MNEKLPDELLWASGGHVSDVVLTALSDGQFDIVPASATAHVQSCAACTHHLGHAALLSLRAGREIEGLGREAPAAIRAFPLRAIGVGLAVALVGAAPALFEMPGRVAETMSLAVRSLPLFLREGQVLFRGLEGAAQTGLVLTFGSALVLILLAVAVARSVAKGVSR